MGYVGNQTSNSYSSMDKQTITGNGGASYTLTHAVANAQEIEVFVNNVRQEAGIAYTVAGTALSMTGNVASTDDFYVIYQGKALQTVVPPDGSVSTAKIASGAVTSAKLDTNIDIAGTLDVSGVLTADSGIKLSTGTDALTTYEVGTWTPSDASGAGLTLTVNSANYVRVGNAVHLQAYFTLPSTSNTSVLRIGGLPFTSIDYCTMPINSAVNGAHVIQIQPSNTEFNVMNQTNQTFTNNQFSAGFMVFSGTYLTS